MSETLKRLTVKEIEALVAGKALADGGGLLYRSTGKAQGKWAFKFTSPDPSYRVGNDGKIRKSVQRELGLGAYPTVGLSIARDKAEAMRAILQKGLDPIEALKAAKAEGIQNAIASKKAAAEEAMTFGRYADEVFLPSALAEFSNSAHIQQWTATFSILTASLRDRPISNITREDVLTVLRPIWTNKYTTASRSRQRIERLFAHAIQNGHFHGDNPASWRQFDATLPAPRKEPRHHPAIPHEQIASFVCSLRDKQSDSMAALMLEWITLSACRSGEARFATWGEIDLERKLWSIPAKRMKMRRDHIVPITVRMEELLVEAKKRHPTSERELPLQASDFLFANDKGKPLSEMAALMLIRRMDGFSSYTAHGLRATFKGWAATSTDYPRELIEEQLAHQLGAVERAYMRQSAYARRRPMMEAWAGVCAGLNRSRGEAGKGS